jgi:hypothetical protein
LSCTLDSTAVIDHAPPGRGNDDGIILDYSVEPGAAPDAPQLAPAIDRVRRRTGRTPAALTADRRYGEPAVFFRAAK